MDSHTAADQDSKVEINDLPPFQPLEAPEKEAAVDRETFNLSEKREEKQKEGDSSASSEIIEINDVPPFQPLEAPQKEAAVDRETFNLSEKRQEKQQKEGDSSASSEIIVGNNNEEKSANSSKLKRLISLRDLDALDDAQYRFERDQRRRLALASWDWHNVISISDEEDDAFQVDEFDLDFPDSPHGPPPGIASKPTHLSKRTRVLRVLDFSDDEASIP